MWEYVVKKKLFSPCLHGHSHNAKTNQTISLSHNTCIAYMPPTLHIYVQVHNIFLQGRLEL